MAAAAWSCVENMLQEAQRTSAPRAVSVSISAAVWIVMCRLPAMRAPLSGFSAPYFWAKYEDPRYIEAAAYILNRELLDLGCNLNFAPVLDLYGNGDHTIIGDRSLGSDSIIVGQLGTSYLKGAKEAGIIPVVKHFPGHGLTEVDSHLELPVVAVDEEYLINNDLVPFQMAIESGVDMIMTAHVLYKEIDPVYPATLSRARDFASSSYEKFAFI